MPPRPRMLAAAITAALALGAQAVPAAAADGPAGDSTATTSRGVEIPAFYTPPSELPAADGTLIRHEPLPWR